jgi:PAS domain S-box-containing protein
MSGYTREELIGKSIFSFLAPEYVEEAIKNTAAMQEGALGPKKYDLIMKDGSRATFEANGDLMRGADGSVREWCSWAGTSPSTKRWRGSSGKTSSSSPWPWR